MDILSKVKETLKKDNRLTAEDGSLLKSKIIELTLKLDKDLLTLLLTDPELKTIFFVQINETLVFDQNKFIKFVDNKEFLPDSFTTFKNKIGLSVGARYFEENKEVALSGRTRTVYWKAAWKKKARKGRKSFSMKS